MFVWFLAYLGLHLLMFVLIGLCLGGDWGLLLVGIWLFPTFLAGCRLYAAGLHLHIPAPARVPSRQVLSVPLIARQGVIRYRDWP